ncbi:MAG: hypothetical protein L6R41_003873 [Letrouitia leprolyta]|nr:MAG: hypothetical protein L6R41_003873 [Letrouitia leprolyta]
MPFIPHTPESRISRSDSKDEATTCKGTTMSGRPCRRGLDVRRRNDGVLAVLPNGNPDADSAAAFFCWQHKDQADNFVSTGQSAAHVLPLKGRTSTDTLVERLGLIDLEERRKRGKKPVRKEGLPEKWQEIPGPLLTVSTSGIPRRPKRRPHPILSFLCCGSLDEPEPHHAKPHQEMSSVHNPNASLPTHIRQKQKPAHQHNERRPHLQRDPSSQTESLLTWIPKSLSPQITSQLLAELAKPISEADEEGYIYIFWLTTTPTTPDASALLIPSPLPSPSSSPQPKNKSKILIKIGRTSNVQRRMNEWTRQCGYNLSLIRFYPYLPSTPKPSPSRGVTQPTTPKKVPHAHKVERLIHIELADKRSKRGCETCGKEHREWFEVDGDRKGVKGMDEVVRRWVRWGESMI